MKKVVVLLLLVASAVRPALGQQHWMHGQLKVSADGHSLQYEDGKPFFWLGDTAWELFHRLKLEEIATYLENRKKKGFTVIQAVVLAEMDGLRKPNQYGETPFLGLDPARPSERYFRFIDSVVKLAMERDLHMGLLPTWGDKVTMLWGSGPVVFDSVNAYSYGLWVGRRYARFPNIVWILGGDRPATHDGTDWRPVWRAMARGILEGTQNKALITYHPWGGEKSSSQYLHTEEWLSMNMLQSGHGAGHDVAVWTWIQRDRSLRPSKPVLDAEPNYEDHPVNPWPTWNPLNGYFREYDVRKQTYRSIFAGACGVTYGHHSVWQFWSPREEKINHADRYWTEALDRPGAFQVGYLRNLMESRPLLTRIPDQSIIEKGQGEKGEYVCACRDSAGTYAFIYLPVGKAIRVSSRCFKSGIVMGWWFNPRNGEARSIGQLKRRASMEFTSPTTGIENDWVLVLDDPGYRYGVPGVRK